MAELWPVAGAHIAYVWRISKDQRDDLDRQGRHDALVAELRRLVDEG